MTKTLLSLIVAAFAAVSFNASAQAPAAGDKPAAAAPAKKMKKAKKAKKAAAPAAAKEEAKK